MRPTRLHRLLALVVVLVAGAALPAAAGARGGATPDMSLLRAYQPVLVFHPQELFRPTKVQSFVEDSRLERFVGTSPAQLPLDAAWELADPDPGPGQLGSLPAGTYRLNQAACSAAAPLAGLACYAAAASEGAGGNAVYGRVVRTATHVVLQYWLFYHHNPLLLPATPVGTFWQSHEGDWEVVNVVLDAAERPQQAAYSQHCTGQRLAWADVERAAALSAHPKVYVGLGSHANFFRPGPAPLGAVPFASECIPASIRPVLASLPFLAVVDQVVDGSAAGAVAGPPASGFEPTTIHGIEGAPWAAFDGYWGETEYFFTPIPLGPVPAGAVPVGLAPRTPTRQANWDVETVLAWPLAP
jgi:hypothetical protein